MSGEGADEIFGGYVRCCNSKTMGIRKNFNLINIFLKILFIIFR